MSRNNEEMQIPNLGPANPANSHTPLEHSEAIISRNANNSSSNSILQTLVIIILIASVSALGYFGFGIYQTQLKREQTFQQAQQQIEQLKVLLQQAEQGAEKSGKQLQGNVSSLESRLLKKDHQLDSEIAKLWDLANKANRPLIKQQGLAIEEQKKQIATQQAELKKLTKSLATQTSQFNKLTTQLKAVEKKQLQVETEMRTTTGLLQERLDELSDKISGINNKGNSGNASILRRIAATEQAVRAFDSTRRQLNQDILQVKQKVNRMQLQLEQR